MKKRWEEFCLWAQITDKAFGWWDVIEACYSGRAYHNLDHIERCLNEFQLVQMYVRRPLDFQLAIWFHDLIYTPGNNDNEAKSSAIARSFVCNLPTYFSQESVEEYIWATTHNTRPTYIDEQLICDIDLASLGQKFPTFFADSRNVCVELGISQSDPRRLAFLDSLVARKTIYHTQFFQDRYEQQARSNIRDLKKYYSVRHV